jgi:hypothetical protein
MVAHRTGYQRSRAMRCDASCHHTDKQSTSAPVGVHDYIQRDQDYPDDDRRD